MLSRFLKKLSSPVRQAPSPSERPTMPPSRPMVSLALKEPIALDRQRLFTILSSRYKKTDGTEPLVSIAGPLVTVAGVTVAILNVDAPLPDDWQDLAKPGRNLFFPNAQEVCATHRAHLTLGVMGEETDLKRRARVLTAVAGTIAFLYPDQVLAGIWESKVLNSGKFWADSSADAFSPYPKFPVSLWVSLHPFSDEQTGGVGVLSQGLAQFVGRELELLGHGLDVRVVLQRADGLVTYLVEKGPVLKDGSTFGISEKERIAVAFRASTRFGGLPVIAATLE